MRVFSILLVALMLSAIAEEPAVTRDDAVREALTALKMRERDLSMRSLSKDVFRLPTVDLLMDKPLIMPDFLDSLGKAMTSSKNDEVSILTGAAKLMNNQPQSPVVKSPTGEYPWKNQKDLPVKIREALDLIFGSFEQAKIDYSGAFAAVDSFQLDTIKVWGLDYLAKEEGTDLDNEKDDATLEAIDDAELEAEKRTKRLFEIASKVDRGKIASASLIVLKAAITAEGKLEGITAQKGDKPAVPDSIASGDIIFWCQTDKGMAIIGGSSQTIYKKRFAAIIDLGGDDIYTCAAGGADTTVRFAVAIDLAGNDLYNSDKSFAFGSGGYGVGVLIDRTGNDVYKSDNFGIASGSFGSGILIDRSGDDFYSGDIACQGAAFMGYGILIDRKGNDRYSARLYSQGFGYVGGFGAILEKEGSDSYIVQGAFTDKLRYEDRHLSLSQGFGYGNRPDWSGGIGLILDAAGNDNYTCDIFGQGSSYWFAFGGLWDAQGNDNYIAYQYAQGAATHSSAGILYDVIGADNYVSYGVSQGCGHDLAVGFLLDGNIGDDNYTISDLSQGAGNANGVGILIDEGGDDGYICKKEYNVQGYGNWRRDFGSIGIMLDLSGFDRYAGKGKDSSWWGSGQYGIGIDFPAELSKEK
jgi:hypothetical protein